jgi:hypothetical protein
MELPHVTPVLSRSSPCLDKLNRLAWTHGASFEAYGLRLGIRTNRPEVLRELVPRLPPGFKPSANPRVDRLFSAWLGAPEGRVKRYHLVYAGILRKARTLDYDEAMATLEAEIRQALAAGARRKVFVHAGVVGFEGRAILVPGRSGAGKTTLVAELVRAGATYYSDEFAVLDARGRVHPFAKPLSIRGERGRAESMPVEALGGRAGRSPLRPILVALVAHRAGGTWRPGRLSPAQAVLALLAHTVPVRRRPVAALEALKAALSSAVVVRGSRGEAAASAKHILRAARRALREEQPLRGAA